MKVHIGKLQRLAYGVIASAMVATVAVPVFIGSSSAGPLTERQIRLSNSAPAAGSTTYSVSFKPTSAATIGGIVIDFCGDSPIIGSTTCTLPTTFTLGTTVTVSNIAGFTDNTGFITTNSLQGAAAASNFQVLKLTNNTAPRTPTNFSTTPITFDITGVTNPNITGTFYARIYTFDTQANAIANYTASSGSTTRGGSLAGVRDSGGAALSTAMAINISATVQESLTFCTSDGGAAPGSNCSGTAAPALVLGNGGSPNVLDTAGVYTDTAYHQLSSNAVNGVDVRLRVNSPYTCAGLSRDGGVSCADIPAAGVLAAITAGTAEFGLRVADGTGGTGAVDGAATYEHASNYAMNNTNVTTGGGDIIHTSAGATTNVNSLLTYGATASASTPPGVYATVNNLIATGKF